MKVLEPAVTVKTECVEVNVASVTVPDSVPSFGLATPNRLYVAASTRAITDQTNSLPAQNWALVEGSDSTEVPGNHAVGRQMLVLLRSRGIRRIQISAHLIDMDSAPPKDMMEAAMEYM